LKDKILYSFGLCITIIIIIHSFFPIVSGFFIYSGFGGLLFNIWVGILFLVGGNRVNKKIIDIGFAFGLLTWFGLIFNAFNDILWSQRLNFEKEFISLLLYAFKNSLSIEITLIGLYYVFFCYSLHSIGFMSAYIRLFLIIPQIILGTISFIRINRLNIEDELENESDTEKLCPNCLFLIPKNAIICEYCGINILNFNSESHFIKQKSDKRCPYCHNLIEKSANFCTNCGIKLKFCKICNYFIKNEEPTVTCPNCANEFHELEFLEWIKIKARCPVCRIEIDLWEFQKIAKEDK